MNDTEIILLTQAEKAMDLYFTSIEEEGLQEEPARTIKEKRHVAWYDRLPKSHTGPLSLPQTGPLNP
jgi:hypothetical protein